MGWGSRDVGATGLIVRVVGMELRASLLVIEVVWGLGIASLDVGRDMVGN